MKILVALLLLVTAATAVSFTKLLHEEWKGFKHKMFHWGHLDGVSEELHRKGKQVSYEDLRKEQAQSCDAQPALYTWTVHLPSKGEQIQRHAASLCSMSLYLFSLFTYIMNGFNTTAKKNLKSRVVKGHGVRGASFLPPANVDLPKRIDWRAYGAVTKVKDQENCGSCWAFSATGALEAQHFRKTGYLVSLSEQNLIDCTVDYGNHGCEGGVMDNAFKYIKDTGGIDTEYSYPYEAMDDNCRYNPKDSGAEDIGFVDIASGDEKKLMAAVATVGPVSAAIDGSLDTFQLYSDGVYYDKNCSSTNLNHAVLVVGYGTDELGGEYWLVKNSWGESWGFDGYFKIARNRNNHCGIATSASYPIV